MDLRTEGKTTKKKRRFPLFDIAVLLLLALTVIGGSYWATHRQSEVPTGEIVYTVRFAGVDNAYSGTLAEGKTLYSTSGIAMGEIEAVSVTRALEKRFDGSVSLAEGEEYRYTEVRSTEKSDVVITVRVTAEVRDGGCFVSGNRIAAGMTVDAMVTGYLGEGQILTVLTAENAEQQAASVSKASSEASVP